MTANHVSQQVLWKRAEDARLRWLQAHDDVKEINWAAASIANHDGVYAYSRTLDVEALAVKDYLDAFQRFRVAVSIHTSNATAEDDAPGGSQAEDRITPREREVLALIASGKSSKQVAHQLGISFKTAACHRYRIQTKLEAGNTADLTRAALRMGLIDL